MKTYPTLLTLCLAAGLFQALPARSQGMPAEMHQNIHTLFDQHAKFTRKVQLIEKGYVAITESEDPKMAAVLREHVSQMRKRLQSGMMVRRWDPAFPELVQHYDDITHRVEATPKGLKITVEGKNPKAVLVAQNHAKVVSDFVKNGWKAHDTRHPEALAQKGDLPTNLEVAATSQVKPMACAQCQKGQQGSEEQCKTACDDCQKSQSKTKEKQ